MSWQWVVNAKDLAQFAQAVVTVIALIAAGVLFWRRRRRYPRLKITQAVDSHLLLGNKRLIHVSVTLENMGERLFKPNDPFLLVQQVRPIHGEIMAALGGLPATMCLREGKLSWPSVAWTHLKDVTELEPGESESHYCDFLIDPAIEVIAVYTRVPHPTKKDTGWNVVTMYEIPRGIGKEEGLDHAGATSADAADTPTIPAGNQAGTRARAAAAKANGAAENGEKVAGPSKLGWAFRRGGR